MLVEVDHVTKRYGDKLAVDDLSFSIDQGEVVGFLGPNGAGKSTTMNMITGYLSATEGNISIAGYDILEEPIEAKKHIGYLPEMPPLYVDMTVHEYLDFLYELKKCKIPRRQHLEEICEAVRITDVFERVIRNLSKGYRQRVGLAGALIGSPELLILDEPTVGLDPQQIIEIRSLIKELGSKCTVILSSHILSEIEAVCNRVLVIDHGRLIADDSPDNLSKNLSGDASVHVRVLGDEEGIRKTLVSLPKVKEVVYNGLKEESAHEFRVVPEERVDLRSDIAKALVNGGFDVIGLRFAEMTLEEIFLDLIAKEDRE
ncbi:MAG: ATP-binding cassette domain-containing protein [Oscillospiraceae bacterium]|nr:ATP-binding cassette domain-containing protein [Oscillospiraceae bacterium]MBR0450992.1 ATP-binding cassette domain-containing protein [Oscillospiraceae bacterium]